MAAAAIPAAMGVASMIQNRNAGKPSGSEQNLINAQTANAVQTGQQGKELYRYGMPLLQRSSNYYNTILNGGRAAQAQAMQPEFGAISDVYRGATRSLDRSGIRGGARDTATAEMSRERAGRIAGLVPGQRPAAAGALASMGQYGTSGGVAAGAQSANVYSDLINNAQRNRTTGTMMNYQQGMDLGEMMGMFLKQGGGSKAEGWKETRGGTTTTVPKT